MKPEAQRIAIAEACGWKIKSSVIKDGWCLHKLDGTLWTSFWDSPTVNGLWEQCIDSIPNYLSDLNAMHEAEKVLTLEQQGAYTKHLKETCKRSGVWAAESLILNWFWHATAAQRAEAFLRTIGKWEYSK